MNSDSGTLPSVLSGVSNPSTPHLSSSITPQIQQDSDPTPRVSVRSQGHVYSLSGHIGRQDGLESDVHHQPKKVTAGHYDAGISQRPGKLKTLRLLPYQECHRAQFLCLEQDTELLMQRLLAQIRQV